MDRLRNFLVRFGAVWQRPEGRAQPDRTAEGWGVEPGQESRTARLHAADRIAEDYYVVQYWESKEKLYAYASAPDMFHRKAWAMMNRKEKKTRQHVGLWHKTYIAPEGAYESIYADMPPYGLAAVTGVLPVEGRGRRAADRLAHRSATERKG